VNPVKQEQTPQGVVHFPLPEHEFGHGVYAANVKGSSIWATMTSESTKFLILPSLQDGRWGFNEAREYLRDVQIYSS
jgi:hypothetical protein